MAAKIRQEINILDHLLTATSGSSATSNERAQYDETRYGGTGTAYFEVVAYSDVSLAFDVTLVGATDGTVATINVPTLTTTPTLFRSASFNPATAAQNFTVSISAAVGTNKNVKSARIIIIQSAGSVPCTQTQLEIGNYNIGRTTESAAILTNPKYWKYTAANWDGTKSFFAEAVYDSGDMDTISVYIYESTAIDAPSWSLNATIVSAATTTSPTRTRVSFTPVDGRWYTIFSLNGSMDNHDIYRAGVVVDQSSSAIAFGAISALTSASTGTSVAVSGSNTIGFIASENDTGSDSLTSITWGGVEMTKIGSSVGVPGDRFTSLWYIFNPSSSAAVVCTGGTAFFWRSFYYTGAAQSGQPDSSSTNTSSSSTSISATTTVVSEGCWVIMCQTDGTGGRTYTTDYGSIRSSQPDDRTVSDTNGTVPTGGITITLTHSGVANNHAAQIVSIAPATVTSITKIEPQYLLANTLFAAGTALQTFLTDWDSTEWDDGSGSITYYFQAEAANGSTSDVTLNQADGGGVVTNSTLTNIDNAQISSAMTMPGDENLDVTATTNAGDVAAARILVTYIFASAPPPPSTDPYNGNQFYQLMGVGT